VSVAPAYSPPAITTDYPIAFLADPPAGQSRLTVFFRPLMAIPHLIVLYALNIASQAITLIAWFAILFTGRYPAGMFGFSAGCFRWQTRVSAYLYLLTGVYPPFSLEEMYDYPIRVGVMPQTENRNRLTTFFRILMVIPHLIVLAFVAMAAGVVLIVAWFAALITGRVPVGMHNFLAGTLRWSSRLNAYALLLTDEYPPFSLS
jgi:hypothetical protein